MAEEPPSAPTPDGSDPDDRTFACEQCGAILAFEPGTKELTCQYCGHRNMIALKVESVEEQNLDQAVRKVGDALPTDTVDVTCGNCGASFAFEPPLRAGPCPFCGSPVIAQADGPIPEDGLLPFLVGAEQARERINGWLGRLWFAPSNLRAQTRIKDRLVGIYAPFFTYDSDTNTQYSGLRGDVYYETVRVRVMVDGKSQTQLQQVPKVRWTPSSGRVHRHFDDVVVPATTSQPEHLIRRLRWLDLKVLKPIQDDFLAGFQVERQQRTLREGFALADAEMQLQIQHDIRRQIGGDQQRITAMQVQHRDRSYKLLLLPLWVASLGFTGKRYSVLVNGRTGEVVGERPYSMWKIALAVLAALLVAGGLAVLFAAIEG